ncbi:MAG TPA: CAP domain-containing protein [Candidatus Saccharimonadales bacterium]|nr:CAP domain-containing protein [Candidatus Saccharimonadales bacterium]
MTLVARAKPPAHHKKRSGSHHRRTKSYHKAYWPYLPIALIVLGGIIFNALVPAHKAVLGYATDMSISSLLSDTNAQRSDNGLPGLGLNSQLDQAAQAKANDMAARDYWSHNTPDGQTPWSFIIAAGYNYQTAGENLAYGFDSASETVTGWMNSPEHRANILNTTYKEVGFGVANSANYQGTGPETIVVAMYAEPVGYVAPAPAPAVAQSTPATRPVPAPTPITSAPASQAAPATQNQPVTGQASNADAGAPVKLPKTPVVTTTPLKPVTETKSQEVSSVALLTAGKAPWSLTLLSVVLAVSFLLFFMRHTLAWHKVLRRGERFVIKHPALDIAFAFIIVAGLLLSRTVGSIR